MKAMKRSLLALVVAAASAACSVDAGRSVGEVGQPAPDYAAVTLAGDSVSLASLSGEVVLLNVWATWCHPCREEIPVLQQLHEDHADEGLAVIGVSVDARGEEENIRDFADDYGMTYPVWLDPAERVSAIFRLLGVPSTFLIDRDGTIVWKHLGPLPPGDPGLAAAITGAL